MKKERKSLSEEYLAQINGNLEREGITFNKQYKGKLERYDGHLQAPHLYEGIWRNESEGAQGTFVLRTAW